MNPNPSNLVPFELKNFTIETVVCDSRELKNNPLNDSYRRFNPVLIPKAALPKNGFPVVMNLSGFTGNGPDSFGTKYFGTNIPQQIDFLVTKNKAPIAVYGFVDATTFWGGSQFINSPATGRYESYIVKELVPTLKTLYPLSPDPDHWCLTGASSGGYGAIHLGSQYPHIFGRVAAFAPDSMFEVSLLHDLLLTARYFKQVGGYKNALSKARLGQLSKIKNYREIWNGIAMSVCYGGVSRDQIEFPIDLESGELIPSIWKKWLTFDPIEFLPKRKAKLKKLSGFYLDVGTNDEFFLHFGARKIHSLLNKMRIRHVYKEFDGGHFDTPIRRPLIYEWLRKSW